MALHSQETIAAVQLIADMYLKHKIIPRGRSRGTISEITKPSVTAGDFRSESYQYYAHLMESDKELYDVTGLLPVPAGPAGAIEALTLPPGLSLSTTPIQRSPKGSSSTGWPPRTCG